MKNSKILIGLLFLMIFVSCKTTKVESEKTVSKKSTKYTVIQLSEKSEYLNSSIKYPKFEDYSLLNKVVKNSVENYFNSFNRYAKSDWEELNKVRAIEIIDEQVLPIIFDGLKDYDDYKIMILPDHPTPIVTATHASDPVPFMIYHKNNEVDGVETINEETAKATGLFIESGVALMKKFLED